MKFCKVVYFILLTGTIGIGCASGYKKYISSYANNSGRTEPDYSILTDWAAHPWKKDPSDSVPKPVRSEFRYDSTVDVFFLHPTTLTDKEDLRWNADIEDDTLNTKTDYSSILYQASAFNQYRVFAPRYRQAHIRCYFVTDTPRALQAFEKAYKDVKAAFEYYLQHFNNGRPIIIASHSQGSTHAQRLVKEYFDNDNLQNKLVVAYITGMYIPDDYFFRLSVCSDSLQTGCICAWRTYKKNYVAPFVQKEGKTKWVTNPLTGTNTQNYVGRDFNKGAILKNFNKFSPGAVDAQINGNVVWVSKLYIPGAFLIKTKNYHIGDINLFWKNIREDAQRRLSRFRNKIPN
jgi:hypothetical protein